MDTTNHAQVNAVPKEHDVCSLRVLVVDDERAVRDVLAYSLVQRGFSVLTAFDLRSAVEAAKTRPDVILLDVLLGGEDGLELINLLRETGLVIPCVVLTGHAGPYEGFKARDLGVHDLLQKPLAPDDIAAALRRTVIKTRSSAPVAGATSSLDRHGLIPAQGHVHDRISAMIVNGIRADVDLPTVAKWSRYSGVAESTLKTWCAAAEIAPKRALLFARILRALHIQRTTGKAMLLNLEIVDRRTIRRILLMVDIAISESGAAMISAKQFLVQQQLVTDDTLLVGVTRRLLETIPDILS